MNYIDKGKFIVGEIKLTEGFNMKEFLAILIPLFIWGCLAITKRNDDDD